MDEMERSIRDGSSGEGISDYLALEPLSFLKVLAHLIDDWSLPRESSDPSRLVSSNLSGRYQG